MSAQRGLRPRDARPRPDPDRFVSRPPDPRPGSSPPAPPPAPAGPPDRRDGSRQPGPPGSRREAALPAPLARPVRGPRRTAAGGARRPPPLARLSRDRRRGGPTALLLEPLGRSRPAPALSPPPPAARAQGRQRGGAARGDRGRPGPRLVPPLEAGRRRPPPTAPVAASATEALDPLPRGVAPARIWMADSGPGFELYSNGLRDRHHLRRRGRAEALPSVRRREGHGGRGPRPAGRHRVPHVGERHLAARGVLQREAARLEPEPAALPEEEPRLPLPDRPVRAGLPGGGGDREGEPRRHVGLERRAAACTST